MVTAKNPQSRWSVFRRRFELDISTKKSKRDPTFLVRWDFMNVIKKLHVELKAICEERKNQQDATISCLLSTSASTCFGHCSHPTTHRPTTATDHIQQNQRSTPYAVTHGLWSPEDWRNDARNMLRQKLIINIWLLRVVGFLSLHTIDFLFDIYLKFSALLSFRHNVHHL